MNKEQIIDWLLEGDVSLQYQVYLDLLGVEKKSSERGEMKNTNSVHSKIVEKKISDFFYGREAAFTLFQILRKLIERNCSPKIAVSKTQISFGEDYKYIWVWLPQMWINKRSQNSITLTVATGKKLKNRRIIESVQPKKGFWTHHILIDNKNEIDSDVEDLIKASYRFYLQRKELKDSKAKIKVKPSKKGRT